MFNKYNLLYSLYFIDMSIINYRRVMLYPLWNLEKDRKLTYNQIHYNNLIQNRYWNYMKLYNQILKWR